jgi:hypothetical protein
MRKWNRTVMNWDCHLGLETDIEVDDMPNEPKKPLHAIHSLKITSLPGGRRALVETTIRRCMVSPRSDKRTIILERFKQLVRGDCRPLFLSGLDQYDMLFRIVYSLQPDETFCDWAVDYVGRFHAVFKVDDKRKFRQGEFQMTQQTFVLYEGRWVDFAWWLRETRYHLPQVYECEEAELDATLV